LIYRRLNINLTQYCSYNADEKEKAPQEYYLWGLNQLKKINTMKSFPKIG